jgi:hypothetical protein
LRFRLDSDGDSLIPNSPHMMKPKQAALDHARRVEFLKLLHDGLGWTMACAQLGISLRDLRRALSASAGFRKAVEQIEQVRAERLYSVLYEAALNGDTRAAQFLLNRHDRSLERRSAQRHRSV